MAYKRLSEYEIGFPRIIVRGDIHIQLATDNVISTFVGGWVFTCDVILVAVWQFWLSAILFYWAVLSLYNTCSVKSFIAIFLFKINN